MNFSRYISKKVFRLLPIVAAGLLWGCTADVLDMYDSHDQTPGDAELKITLAIPRGESIQGATRAIAGDGPVITPAQSADDNELGMNDLRLYLFPSGNPSAPAELYLSLDTPGLSESKTSETYYIKGLKKGTRYQLYLIANFGNDGMGLESSTKLEQKIIDYSSNPHNLVPGNLPMVYKHPVEIQITDETVDAEEVTAVMKYACTKIRYNIIFDKTSTGNAATIANFAGKNLAPQSLELNNVTQQAKVMWEKDPNFYKTNKLSAAKGLDMTFYTSWDQKGNVPTDGTDMITNPSGVITKEAAASADKWLLRGTVYVPERYVTASDDQTSILMKSKVGGSDVKHGTPIGIKDNNGNFLDLDRSTYYELVGTVVNTNIEGTEWKLNVRSWLDETIDADFVHTFLHLEDVKTTVTSFDDGVIGYDTDGRGAIALECDDDAVITIDGKKYELFELAPLAAAADGMKQLAIQVNSDVPILKLNEMGKASGTAHAFIVAGNIKKQIEIDYNIEPFIEFTPVSIKIQDGDGVDPSSRYFEYRTNCGGFIMTCEEEGHDWEFTDQTTGEVEHKITSDGSNYSSFTMKIRENASSASEGIIEITDNHPDETTVVHSFVVRAKETLNRLPEEIYVKVEVMPKREYYRVYFRAINDYHTSNDAEFGTVLSEQTSTGLDGNNWTDYWGGHYLYAYTQYGETPNKMPVWRYTADFGATTSDFDYLNVTTNAVFKTSKPAMEKDAGNPGWYYYDIPVSCVGNYVREGGAEDATAEQKAKYGKGPLPGATLLIFYSSSDVNNIHRVNQHKEAGIPLGDYNDYESWVLFDPSRDPVYNVYDDKPTVINQTYTVYSDTKFNQWINDYGNNNIHKTLTAVTSDKTDQGYTYKYNITLKAPRGEYDKNISLVGDAASVVQTVCVGLNDVSDWGTPYALFNDGNGEEYVLMKKIPGKSSEYYVEVPTRWQGKNVKFCNNAKSQGCRNWKNYSIDNSNTIQFAYTNSNWWGNKTDDYKNSIFGKKVLMFNGNSWTLGYYKSSRTGANKWSKEP